jgi:dTDP-glucose 4,6-dehydratase
VLGTFTLLEECRRHRDRLEGGAADRFRVVHVSTDEVYGSLGEDGRFDESSAYDPSSPYSATKAAADHLARAWHRTYGLPVTVTNCSNNYGPYQFPEKLVPLMILNALEGRELPVYGRGENVRDWLYVEDHCEAIELILHEAEPGRTYLIGGATERTNLELVELLLDLVDEALERPAGTGRGLISFVKDRPGHDFRYAMDFARLHEDLGWQPRHSLEDGLRETVRWYLANPEWLESVRNQSYRDYYQRQYG